MKSCHSSFKKKKQQNFKNSQRLIPAPWIKVPNHSILPGGQEVPIQTVPRAEHMEFCKGACSTIGQYLYFIVVFSQNPLQILPIASSSTLEK